ncbi:hypothetical protein Q31b_53870 [Novipirellula aureliae]|uniref:Periplasmic folding chaperone n=1 Tax=Novipirellula aureliae TaxID=2527966 RepID=A0A5C6DHU2_9BACT|nr:hypothetical protein [Novipirellula aureliae]TWU35291.1 hypothetical protein Q31b_53870 [Novipirellula aureliae]
MNNSPFEIFRRNLKPLMVVLIGLAMFSFVVLPALQTYLQRNQGAGDQVMVATFDGKSFSESRVAYLTRNHGSTVRFLRELAEETIRRGGMPKTPGFRYDAENKQVTSLGISETPDDRLSVRTLQFAAEAKKAGLELDDAAIGSWLASFTDGMLSDGEIDAYLMESTQNRMGRIHLYEQLRTHLLADLYQRAGFATVAMGQMPIMTPAEQWQSFLKLNQEATVNVYPILVRDYLDETDDSPTESEIKKVYDEGKDRDSSEQSPEPGFHRRYSAEFEYLAADIQEFIDEEAAKFSEEELRAEYERRLKGGDFQLPEAEAAADAAMSDDLETEEPATEEPATEDPSVEESAVEESSVEESVVEESVVEEPVMEESSVEESVVEEPAVEEPAMEESSVEEPAVEEPVVEEPAVEESAVEEPAVEESAVEEPAVEEPAEEDQSRMDRFSSSNGVRLVAMQDEEATDNPAEEAEAEQPNTDQPEAGADELEAETDTEAEMDTAETEVVAETDDTAETEDVTETEDAAETETEQPKTESFEDVRDQIANSLAVPKALKRMETSVMELDSKMRRYFNEKAIYDSNASIGQAGDAPEPLDLKAIGEELGFRYEKIGPYNTISIAEHPISNSLDVGSQEMEMQRGPSFATIMFGGVTRTGQQIPMQELYSPLRTVDDQGGKIFVSWKINETEAYTPKLEEVREEVIAFIRLREARKLAVAAAEKISNDANAEGKSLIDVLPEDKQDQVLTDLGPFSWMDSFGFQGASIGNVPELDSVGEAFMKTVFNTEIGKTGVALNQPERVVFVVEPTAFQPDIEALKAQFKNPRDRIMAMFSGGGSANQIITGFFESIDERTGFTFTQTDEE